MHQFLVSAVAFIVLVGVMVTVHEFGHFVVAKLFRVRVEAFSFGFGPRLFGFKYGDTDYKICLLPLGGYVKMTGENFSELEEAATGTASVAPENDPGAFTSHPRWQRMLIGLAGPTANFVLAMALMIFYYGWINEVPAVQVKTTTVEWVTPGSAAAQAGFEPGDVIRSFDGVTNPDWDQVYEHAKLNANQPVAVKVERGTETDALTLRVPVSARNDDFDLSDAGLLPEFMTGPIAVTAVEPDTPAAHAGLQAGDAIAAVDGHPFHYISTLHAYIQYAQSRPVTLTVLRDGATITMVARPVKLDASGYLLGFDSSLPPYHDKPLPIALAVNKASGFCADNSSLIVEVLERLFEHRVSVSQLSGPVGIAVIAGQAAETKGWYPKFGLAAEISLNLGILNLLPFPILDGGMILFLLIESFLRRDININVKERIYQAAFVVLMFFFVFIIFSDVSKLQMFTHVRP